MGRLPSNFDESSPIANANATIAVELDRIANFPRNLMRLSGFVIDLKSWIDCKSTGKATHKEDPLCSKAKPCGCDDAKSVENHIDLLEQFRTECANPQAEEAIKQLGLSNEDLLYIYRIFFCGGLTAKPLANALKKNKSNESSTRLTDPPQESPSA